MAFKFKGVDFLGFDNLLSEDERMARDTAPHHYFMHLFWRSLLRMKTSWRPAECAERPR